MGNSYMLLFAAAKMNYNLYKLGELELFFIHPLDTPGVQKLYKLMSLYLIMAMGCAVWVELPVLGYVFFVQSEHDYVPVIVMSVLSIGTLIMFGFIPQIYLALIVKIHKEASLKELQGWLVGSGHKNCSRIQFQSSSFKLICDGFILYNELKKMRIWRFDFVSIGQYAFSFSCAFLPLVLGNFFK